MASGGGDKRLEEHTVEVCLFVSNINCFMCSHVQLAVFVDKYHSKCLTSICVRACVLRLASICKPWAQKLQMALASDQKYFLIREVCFKINKHQSHVT